MNEKKASQLIVWLIAAALLIALSVSANAQEPSPPSSDEVRTGTISGRVVNESGQPLIGAAVFVRPAGAVTVGRTTTSNAEGNFQVTGLDNGLYYVSANSPAYVSRPRDVDTPAPTYRVGDTVRIDLVRGGVITGTVSNALGEPVVGVRVRTIMTRDASGKSTKGAVFSLGERTTDDRGIYRIYGLAPGTYIVQAGGGGGMQPSLNVTDFDAPTFAPSSTRDTAAEIQVRSGEEANADIRYRAEPGHSVSGVVKSQGSSGSNVTLTQVGDGVMPGNMAYQSHLAKGFVIYGVADGDYDVTAQEPLSPTGTPFPEIALSDPVRIAVRGADVSGLELIPKPLASIAGRFALETSKLPDCQNKRQPLFNETILTLVVNRKETEIDPSSAMRSFLGSVTPDKDGAFVLKNVKHGQYTFSPRFFGRYWYLRSMTVASPPPVASARQAAATLRDVAKNWFAVKSGDRITGLTITLTEGAASLRGQVGVAEDRQLETGLRVYLVPAERDKVDDPLRYFTGVVNNDGTFAINNLPPGRYFALAQRPPSDNAPQTEKLRLPDATEIRAKLRRTAEAAKTEVELKPCQNFIDYKLSYKPE